MQLTLDLLDADLTVLRFVAGLHHKTVEQYILQIIQEETTRIKDEIIGIT